MTRGWFAADTCFSAAQQQAAHEVIEHELGGRDRVGLAYLGGSLAVGLGNASSDVDLYVVLAEEGAGRPPHLLHERGGTPVHVEMVKPDRVRALAAIGSSYTTTGLDRGQLTLDTRELTHLVRLLTGWRLVCTPEWAATLTGLRREVVRQVIIARRANMFGAFAEDVAGALTSGDLYTAALASAMAVECAAEAALAAADDLYEGPKFLFRRLSRTTVTRSWAPVLWGLLNQAFAGWPDEAELASGGQGDARVERMRRIAERRLLAGNFLVTCCLLDGWDQPLRELPPPGADTAAVRSPYFVPGRFCDGWALMGPGQGYEVNEAVIRLWRNADPTSRRAACGHEEDGDRIRALTAIGALGDADQLPLVSRPGPADEDLTRKAGISWAPRFQVHPSADPLARD